MVQAIAPVSDKDLDRSQEGHSWQMGAGKGYNAVDHVGQPTIFLPPGWQAPHWSLATDDQQMLPRVLLESYNLVLFFYVFHFSHGGPKKSGLGHARLRIAILANHLME
jgi:hypothetical protein